MHAIKGKLQTFSLSDNPKDGKKYITANINYGVFRRFFHTRLFNPVTNEGEQRKSKNKRISQLKSVFSNFNYTPASFNACVTDLSQVNIDAKGNVEIPLTEESKLAVLDGGSRTDALELLRQEGGKTARMVDDLPIPIIIHLDPESSKQDFINLNSGLNVNKSLLQSLNIAAGRMKADKLPVFEKAKEIAIALNETDTSPLHKKITFGQSYEGGLLQASELWTDHKGSLIASLFGSVGLLEAMEKDVSWFVDQFISLYTAIEEETDCLSEGKLLSIPPKGNVANWISMVNCVIHYLYLRNQMDLPDTLEENLSHIVDCAQIYTADVDGNVTRKRRQTLSCVFAQRLFREMEDDNNSPVGFHFGIPISLIVKTSNTSFGIEALPVAPRTKKGKSSSKDVIDSVEETKIDSDTDTEWSD